LIALCASSISASVVVLEVVNIEGLLPTTPQPARKNPDEIFERGELGSPKLQPTVKSLT
jgi:hypothetical protein